MYKVQVWHMREGKLSYTETEFHHLTDMNGYVTLILTNPDTNQVVIWRE